ncbi:MAG: ABC transporter substrate-binding protein [Alphaproteobacteria bacterium]
MGGVRKAWLAIVTGVAVAVAGGIAPVSAQSIKIGDINSYSRIPAFTQPYRNGLDLAVEEINRAGGVLGRDLEIISRDDGGTPAQAVTAAGELVSRHGAAVLVGTFFSNVGLAVSDFAKQRKVLFLASEPLTDAIVWEQGHRYVYRLRPSTTMQAAMLADQAAKLPAVRWATIAPNYEYGQSAVTAFKRELSRRRPDVQWIGEQWPAQGRLEAGPTVEALAALKPDAIFNATFAADLAKFVREGNLRGLFKDRPVVSFLSGEPEYLDPLKDETPTGWVVTGYPWSMLETVEHRRFRDAYMRKFSEHPHLGSVVGYATVYSVAAAIQRAGSTDTEKMVDAFSGLELDSPFGRIRYRAGDHQSTLGAFVGRLAVQDGKGVMVDWFYADGAHYLPAEAEAAKLRPAN